MIEVDNTVLKQLFLEIADNSSSAFEHFYNHTRQWVFVRLIKLSRCHDKAEDLTQAFYVLMWEKRSRLSEVENPMGFITTCLQRHAINFYRKEQLIKKQKAHLLHRGIADEGINYPQEKLAARQLEALIEQATNTLPPNQQTIYRLRQYHTVDYEQIGALMGLAPVSCHTYHYMALKQIRNFLRQHHN